MSNRQNKKLISLEEAKIEFDELQLSIERLFKKVGNEGDNIQANHEDPNKKFFRDQYQFIINSLEDIKYHIEYLSKPIIIKGQLIQDINGKYTFPNGVHLTNGSTCEIFYSKEDHGYWIYTSIGYHGKYYATALGVNTSLDGMMARIRG